MPVQTPLPPNYLKNNETDSPLEREQSGNKWSFLSQIIAAGFRPIVPPKSRRAGFVYFATDGELVKIGHSLWPKKRVAHLRSPAGKRLEMIANFRGFMDEEHSLHRLFAAHLACLDEWFHPCPEIENFIALLERYRAPLTKGRITITDVVFGRHIDILEIPPMTKEIHIPKESAEFERWAGSQCPIWPAELQAKAAHALYALKKQYGTDPADIDRFADAYRQWSGI